MDGKIFGSWNIREAKDIATVFPVLLLMGGTEILKDKNEDVAAVYEYMSEALPISLNGYPMFFSVRVLNRAENKVVCSHLDRIREQRKKFLSETTKT